MPGSRRRRNSSAPTAGTAVPRSVRVPDSGTDCMVTVTFQLTDTSHVGHVVLVMGHSKDSAL